MASYKVITPPSATPITLDEAKSHLRVVGTYDDSDITAYIKAATAAAENFMRSPIMQQTQQMYLDANDVQHNHIRISQTPVTEIKYIKYLDLNNDVQTLDANHYKVDLNSNPARIIITHPPTVSNVGLSVFTVEFVCGYATASVVPDPIKSAIKLIVGHLYEHREDVTVGASGVVLPMGSQYLLQPYQQPYYYTVK